MEKIRNEMQTINTDFLVIGSGIAGLTFAMKAAHLGTVAVVTKKQELDTATNLAQGGVAAVIDPLDSFEEHIRDTLEAGDGLCDKAVVEMVVKAGPARIQELLDIGVQFMRDESGSLSLGKEGGHSRRRVAHATDLTGKEIERALVGTVANLPQVKLFENHMCVDLMMTKGNKSVNEQRVCAGAFVLDDRGEFLIFRAKVVILCTGGVGKVYLYTSNPDIATGDGVAMAYRVGAIVENMEFVQFHPTCLYHHKAKNFLISEAVRGEGAYLLNSRGERFMKKYEPTQMELSTRDKVARAIDDEMKKSGDDCVYLDISHRSPEFVKKRFPNIYQKCLGFGLDITKEPIPVVPAAHYMCGGVKTDKYGRTSISRLFALGETACTGLHGGNRLASNSLLEALVFAHSAYNYCVNNWENIGQSVVTASVQEPPALPNEHLDEEIRINHNWDVIRRVMWNYVGIVRKESRLLLAKERIMEVKKEIDDLFMHYRVTHNMLELRNISLVAKLIIEASIARKESVGLHYLVP
jgi:L-aspartate oxidase